MLDELAGLHVELDPPDVAGRSQLDDRLDVADDAFFLLRGLCDAPLEPLEAALVDAAGEAIPLGLGSSCGFPPKAAADALAESFEGYAGGVDGADRGLVEAESARARTLVMGADSERERKLPRGFVVTGDLHAAAAPADLLTREGCGEWGESGPSRSGETSRELNPKQPMVMESGLIRSGPVFSDLGRLREGVICVKPEQEDDRNNQRRRLYGLDKDLVKSFPTFVFAPEQAKESDCVSYRQCCICLQDYEPGDEIKSLPVCGHRFHDSCIDMWLEGKRTCPVCRANLRPKPTADSGAKSSADGEHEEADVAIVIGQPCDSNGQMSSAAANITRNYGLDASSTSIIVTISAILLVLVSFAFCLSFVRNRAFARRRRSNLALENGGAARGRPGTRGLDEELVRSFPTFIFSPEAAESGRFVANGGVKWGIPGEDGGGDKEGGDSLPNWGEEGGFRECAVCLAEYVSADMLKLLPPCGHVFHVDCIDTWLQGKSTCPICRREIGQNADVKEGDSEGGGAAGDGGEQSERGEQGESSTGGGVASLEADREELGQQAVTESADRTDNPLTRAKDHPKIAHALAELAVEQGPDSITASQKEAAEQLMGLVVAEGAEDQALAEAAAQLLAMTAADDKKNPHLMHVDRWVSTCCGVLKRCKAASDSKRRKSISQADAAKADTATAAVAGGDTGGTEEAVSEALLVCMASCLADLMNNPRSTIVCSTRAQEIFQCLQPVLLLPRVSNRLLYFQVCRAISEVLHPSTWPMNQSAAVPKRLLERLIDLITPVKASSAGGVKGADGSGDKDAGGNEADATAAAAAGAVQNVAENGVGGERETEATEPALANGTAAADAEVAKAAGAEATKAAAAAGEQEGGGSEGSSSEGDLTESLIHMQACKALLVMATNGAADLIVQHVPGVIGALERLRQESGVEEAVVQADAALMALWLSPKGYALTNPELRPVVAAHLLRVLGSPDLVDNHQDVSLALVTSTINPDAATRASMLQLYAGLLSQQLELTHILIGHVDDTDSLAHQSVVYFVLHTCESEDCAKAFTANQADCEALVAALVVAAQAENHYAPIAVLVRLASRPSTRDQVLTHIDTRTLNRLRAIPGTRARREVDQLAAAFAEYKGEKPPERTASMPSEEEQSKEDILRDIVRSQSHRSLKLRTAGGNSFEDLPGAAGSVATEIGAGAAAPVPSSGDSSSLLDLNVDVYGGMDQVYLKAAGMRSDFTITFGATVNYQLHKFPLYSKTDYFSKHAVEEEKSTSRRNSGDPESSANGKRARLDLSNLPGGIETFKLVACFCYGVPITITPDNVTALYCAAIYLDMRDDPRAAMCGGPYDCNLLTLASRHLTSYLSHPRAALTVLQSCDASSAIRASAESAGLLQSTVNAVARLVVKEAGKGHDACDVSDGDAAATAAATEADKARREEKAKDKVTGEGASEVEGKIVSVGPVPLWLSPQLLQLTLPTFVQLHAAVSAMGMSALHLCALLEAYCNTWLPFPVDVPSTSTSPAATSADAQTTSTWKPTLEAAVALLFALSAATSASGQAARGAGGLPSIQLLVRLLRLCPEVDASESAKSHLQTMIGCRITECQVDHLLPLPPSEILALLAIFTSSTPATSTPATSAPATSTPPAGSAAAAVEGSGAASLSQAALLLDSYLKAISTSPNSSSISPDSFVSLATALPLTCRPSHDALYEAVAAYVAAKGWGLGGSGKGGEGGGGGERGGEDVKLLVGLIQPEKLSEPVADAASSSSLWPPSFTVAVLTWQKQHSNPKRALRVAPPPCHYPPSLCSAFTHETAAARLARRAMRSRTAHSNTESEVEDERRLVDATARHRLEQCEQECVPTDSILEGLRGIVLLAGVPIAGVLVVLVAVVDRVARFHISSRRSLRARQFESAALPFSAVR
ncbi:unnamed protein product [Closterium sp. Yama58-4]|nr:unnamed protein product [Closterium sp. Yama58-4]